MKNINLFLIVLAALLLSTCEKPERNNPWDENNTLDPEEWAPQNFRVENVTPLEKKLTWTYEERNIEGFKLDRKRGDEPWQESFQVFGKEVRSWNDTGIDTVTSLVYQYRLYAFAGKNRSAGKIVTTSADFQPPTDLTINKNSITLVTLNWEYNSYGEAGFKIERKYETGDWAEVAAITGTSWQDNAFELNTMVYYRVNAYYNQYTSAWVENSFDSTIPPPENLTITVNSATSVTLNWSYSHSGHEGFKIERKIDNGSWLMLSDNLYPNQNSFNDTGLDLPQHDYTYRIYAFFDGFQSNYYVVYTTQYTLSIGEIYKGGIVFYLDGNGGGLVCAESDQSTYAEWGCYGTTIGGTGTGIGTGAANTAAIVAGCSQSGIAARICSDLVLNGYSDWFLPSRDELNLMYQNLKLNGIGGFADDGYWSSSEDSSDYAWVQDFNYGYQYIGNKASSERIRAVRAF
ncbi:MAG TPA: fibronectin type III domain-containing protein [Bacteroidales bacterium]|nr:fibronectin type III domain-containing protein [Bacteroidales bacterium]